MNTNISKFFEARIAEIGILTTISVLSISFKCFNLKIEVNTIDFMINAANTISSILIGFTGVLIGILFGYSSKTINGIKKYRKQDLQKFLLEPIKLGLLVIILGCILFYMADSGYLTKYITHLFIIFSSLVIGLLLSTWRIIKLLTLLILNTPNNNI